MRLLLGSGGMSTEERRQAWREQFTDFLGPIKRVLFVAYAVHDEAGHTQSIRERFVDATGIALDGMCDAADPVAAVAEAEAIFFTGGNTFRQVKKIYDAGILEAVRERVQGGAPYLGVSAGTNVACPTMATTNDMPICWPPSWETFGFVPFQINPHFTPGRSYHVVDGVIEPYAGETRLNRLEEYHEMNDRPVLALREGAILRVEGDVATLVGPGGAILLRQGEPPETLSSGTDVSYLLAT